MSEKRNIYVGHCVVELTQIKQNKESNFFESSPFIFLGNECRIKINHGWDVDGRNVRIYVKANPTLPPNFYASVILFKGSHFISCPNKLVQDPIKCIWTFPMSDIVKQIPDFDKWNINFKLVLQKEVECEQKNSDNKLVQTGYYLNKDSIEKLSKDFARILDGDTKYDMELKSGDTVIKCHKAVLRARSKFFNDKLKSTTEDKIQLQYIDPAAFNAIIRYTYTGKSPGFSFELAKNIYKAGDICNTGLLREVCIEFLVENLTVDNACECLSFANDDHFEEIVSNFIMDEEIYTLDEYWEPFCEFHPVLANIFLNKLVRQQAMELRQLRP